MSSANKNTEYHPLVNKIKKRLEKAKTAYKFFEHEAVRTSAEAQAARKGYSLKQGAKAIIISAKIRAEDAELKRSLFMMVFPADMKLDGRAARKILKAKSISFADREQTAKVTDGVEFGGIPPFGDMFNLPVYVDKSLLENEEIVFNCGDRRASIAMKTSDYLKLVPAIVATFAVK